MAVPDVAVSGERGLLGRADPHCMSRFGERAVSVAQLTAAAAERDGHELAVHAYAHRRLGSADWSTWEAP